MTEHSPTHEHAERALDEMQEQSESLGARIEDARADWERKKADDEVPGAAGRPEDAHSGDDAPEADYPAKSDSD